MLYELSNGITYYKEQLHNQLVLFYDQDIKGIFDLSDSKDVIDLEAYRSKLINEGQELTRIDAKGLYILPGFIDIHIHGYKGADVMDARVESLELMKRELVKNGVTAFLATTMTMDKKSITEALDVVKKVMTEQEYSDVNGAEIIGVHLEGPFINSKFKGAQPEKHIIPVEHDILDHYKDIIKVVTIAPETDGGLSTIKKYKNDMNFSLGHSGANYDVAMEAIECGACSTTHLFNAMTGLHHRDPGVVGAALASDCYSELIADNIHVHKDLYKVLVKAKGLDKLLLITDCMQGGGLGDGDYTLGGQKVTIDNGKCCLASGTLAGSVLKINEGFRNFIEASNESVESILPLITLNQARYLGIEDKFGSLSVGKRADMVIMNDTYDITKTIVKGKIVYEN